MKKILQDILGSNGEVYRVTDSDTIKSKAYYISFRDWEIQNNRDKNGHILDNMDYWMPIIRNKFPHYKIESYFHNSNSATLYFEYVIKKERKDKLIKILNDDKK